MTTIRDPAGQYLTPLSIPEGKSGNVEVRHVRYPKGKPLMLVPNRTALFRGGTEAMNVAYPFPTVCHELLEDGSVWTTDLPCEIEQQRRAITPFYGSVLVGGLGLGLVTKILADSETAVQYVTAVEINPDVVKLVEPHIQGAAPVSVITADLFDFLRREAVRRQMCRDGISDEGNPYTWAFFDTWRHDGEWTLYKTVWPLRRLARACEIPDERILCWNEDVMRGQIWMGLESMIRSTCAFYQNPELSTPNPENEKLRQFWQMTPERVERRQVPPLQLWYWRAFFREGHYRHRVRDALVLAHEYVQTFGWKSWEFRFSVPEHEIPTGPDWKEPERPAESDGEGASA